MTLCLGELQTWPVMSRTSWYKLFSVALCLLYKWMWQSMQLAWVSSWVFVREKFQDAIFEYISFCKPSETSTIGKDIFNMIHNVFLEQSWMEKLYFCMYWWCNAISGHRNGLLDLAKEVAPECKFTHCCLHCKAHVKRWAAYITNYFFTLRYAGYLREIASVLFLSFTMSYVFFSWTTNLTFLQNCVTWNGYFSWPSSQTFLKKKWMYGLYHCRDDHWWYSSLKRKMMPC